MGKETHSIDNIISQLQDTRTLRGTRYSHTEVLATSQAIESSKTFTCQFEVLEATSFSQDKRILIEEIFLRVKLITPILPS